MSVANTLGRGASDVKLPDAWDIITKNSAVASERDVGAGVETKLVPSWNKHWAESQISTVESWLIAVREEQYRLGESLNVFARQMGKEHPKKKVNHAIVYKRVKKDLDDALADDVPRSFSDIARRPDEKEWLEECEK